MNLKIRFYYLRKIKNTPYLKGYTQSVSESIEKIFQSNGVCKQVGEVLLLSDKADLI
jgi:chaperonin cofactor prefoldin